MIVSGKLRELDKAPSKPRQLGSFILGYSRRLWLKYAKLINPKLDDFVCYDTDTDSFKISAKHHQTFRGAGVLDGEKLGYMDNDCADGGLIYQLRCLAPKCKTYRTLTKYGFVEVENKAKGIMQQWRDPYTGEKLFLEEDWYYDKKPHKATYTSLRKVHKKLNKTHKENNITPFSIVQIVTSRTFNKNSWKGMDLQGNIWVPWGYRGKKYRDN